MRRFQFVWWGWKAAIRGWSFFRYKPADTDLALIYRWSFSVGPVEIRRWV